MKLQVVLACLVAGCGDGADPHPTNPSYRVALVTDDAKFLLSGLDDEHVLSTVEARSGLRDIAFDEALNADAHCGLSPDGDHVALLSPVDGAAEDVLRLDVGDIAGTSVNITSSQTLSPFFGPQWSPDSQRLAYLSRSAPDAPYLLHIDDEVVTNTEATQFAWRPDSGAVAFVSAQPDVGVYITSETGSPRQLASSFTTVARLRFAADTTALAFTAHEVGTNAYSLWTVDTAAGGVATREEIEVDDFAWSPNGTRIAFGSGSRLEVQTPGDSPIVIAEHTGTVRSVQWSSDGQWLAYIAGDFDVASLYVVRTDGTSQPQLASSSTNTAVATFAFSPTHPLLALTSLYDPTRALYFVDLSSGTPVVTQVSSAGQAVTQIGTLPPGSTGWSPDGTKFVYTLDANGFPQPPPTAFIVDATTMPPPPPVPTAEGVEALGSQWSADSKYLLLRYRVQLPDGTTLFQVGRATADSFQPLDELPRSVRCARWR